MSTHAISIIYLSNICGIAKLCGNFLETNKHQNVMRLSKLVTNKHHYLMELSRTTLIKIAIVGYNEQLQLALHVCCHG